LPESSIAYFHISFFFNKFRVQKYKK